MPTPARADRSFRTMVLMGLMMSGAGTVDLLTATLLPITAKYFTDNVGLIAFMVALNRICGFLVQPYAAWKSDRHRGAGGRRRPFLLVGWPVTLASVGILGGLPLIIPEGYSRAAFAVALFFSANLAMQAFLDLCYGSADPLYGDSFPAHELGRASAVRMIIVNLVGVTMTLGFIPLADHHSYFPYLGAMGFLTVSWLICVFFIREQTGPDSPLPPERYNPLKPLGELRDPHTRTVAIVASAVLATLALTEMLHALFVTETLGLSLTVLGQTMAASVVLGLVAPYPLGFLADRIGARRMLIVGFVLVALVEVAFALWVHDLTSLYVCLMAFKAAWLFVHIPMMPLIFHQTPAARRGSIFAAVQMTRAISASVAVIGVGLLAGAIGSYRVCYLVAGGVSIIGLVGALRLAQVLPERTGTGANL